MESEYCGAAGAFDEEWYEQSKYVVSTDLCNVYHCWSVWINVTSVISPLSPLQIYVPGNAL